MPHGAYLTGADPVIAAEMQRAMQAGADPATVAMVGARVQHEIANLARGERHLDHQDHALAARIGHLEQMLHHMEQKHHHESMHKHRRTDAAVGIDSGTTLVAVGATVTILSTPVVPVLIDQLTIPSSIAGFLGIQEIRVGMKPFNAGSSVFSAASFSELAVIHLPMDIGLVAAGTQIQTTILWLGAAPARILGSYLGKNLDNPCAPGEQYNPNGHNFGMHQGPHGMPFHHGMPGAYGWNPGQAALAGHYFSR